VSDKNVWSRDVAVLVARVVIGGIFLAHGAQKIFTWGLSATSDAFVGMGAPLPSVSAPIAAFVELLGGAALVLGIATPVVAALLALDMLGAFIVVHATNGVFVDAGGFELVLALAVGAALVGFFGPQRISLDHLVRSRSNRVPEGFGRR